MMDVTKQETIQALVDEIIRTETKIDILINNAGAALIGFSETVSVDQAQKLFDVNYFGIMKYMFLGRFLTHSGHCKLCSLT